MPWMGAGCCKGDCAIFADTFDRAASDDPGERWGELDGSDWDIVVNGGNGYLHCATLGPLITTTRPSPSRRRPGCTNCAKYAHRVKVKLDGVSRSITRWSVVTHFLTPDDLLYIQYDYDSLNDVVWPYFKSISGGVTKTILQKSDFSPDDEVVPLARDPDGTFHVTICHGNSEWATYTANEEAQWVGCCTGPTFADCLPGPDTLPSSPYEDYGIVGFLEGDFKDFEYSNHWEWRTDCPYCSCFCRHPDDEDDFQCIPSQLTMTIAPHGDNEYECPDIDNHAETLKRGILDTSATPNVFYPRPHAMTWETDHQVEINLYKKKWSAVCDSGLLNVVTDLLPCWDGRYLEFVPSRSTCDPLYLVFSYLFTQDTQCEISEDPLVYGIRPACCDLGECLEDTQANIDLIAGLKWEAIITQ